MPDLYWIVLIGFLFNLLLLAKICDRLEYLQRIEQRLDDLLHLTSIPPKRY